MVRLIGLWADHFCQVNTLIETQAPQPLMAYAKRLSSDVAFWMYFQETDAAFLGSDDTEKAAHLDKAVEQCVL